MKKLLLCLLGVVITLAVNAQQDYLVVWHKDGSKVLFRLTEEPKLTYADSLVTVQAGTTVEYAFQSIRKMTFATDDILFVPELATASERPFRSDGQEVVFLSSDSDLHVRIVSLNGVVLKAFTVCRGERSQFSFQSFAAGVYLMDVNGVTYKIKTR